MIQENYMKIESIYQEWDKDNTLDLSDLARDSVNTAKLHHKYFRFYIEEGMKLRVMKENLKVLKRDRYEWYNGSLDKTTIDKYEWLPTPDKICNTKMESKENVEHDSIIIDEVLKIGLQETKVEYLESIIKMINNRGFQIKAAIDFERFRSGLL